MSTHQIYILPDILRNWPWKRGINPHYHTAQAESVAWLESFKPLSLQAQIAFNKCDFSLLCALTYLNSNSFDLRSCCDMMYIFFLLDDFTDGCDRIRAQVFCDAIMDALENPDKPRPHGEHVLGEIARQFWQRASHLAPKAVCERFINVWRMYMASVVVQADRRSSAHVCTIEEYTVARRNNIGSLPCYALLEISLGLDIPHEVMQHPAIVSLNRDTSDMIFFENDMYSYKKEVLSRDASYNIVTVVMLNNDTDLAGAMRWISDRHDELVDSFFKTREEVLNHSHGVPSWGEGIDHQVALYIDGLGQWIRGNDDWHFESGRYFGDEGLEIQKSRVVA